MVNVGVITDIDGPRCLVHEHRQAPRRDRQFTPLYYDDDTKTYLTKIKASPRLESVIVAVNFSDIMVSGSISASGFVDPSLLAHLISIGVTPETRCNTARTA